MRALLLLAISVASMAVADRSLELERAQQLVAQRKYDAALKELDAASKKGGLDRESVLTLFESRALVEASLGQLQKAEQDFRAVLQLDGNREVTGKYVGAANRAATAALAWFRQNGGIEVGALEPGVEASRVRQISMFVKNDPLRLVAKARIYTRKDRGSWRPTEVRVSNGVASVELDAESVEWWAELLSENVDRLLALGSAGRPIVQTATAPSVAPAARPSPTVEPVPAAAVISTTTGTSSAVRVTGYVLLGGAVAAAVAGGVLGIQYTMSRNEIRASLSSGGADQLQLYLKDQQAIGMARFANALFIAAGALAITGGLCWFLGRDVAVAPADRGVALVGRF